jgi:hypothetical protein
MNFIKEVKKVFISVLLPVARVNIGQGGIFHVHFLRAVILGLLFSDHGYQRNFLKI